MKPISEIIQYIYRIKSSANSHRNEEIIITVIIKSGTFCFVSDGIENVGSTNYRR